MKFKYLQYPMLNGEYIFKPSIPIVFRLGNLFFTLNGLIDSGSDVTILPMEIARFFHFDPLKMQKSYLEAADGEKFIVYRSPVRLEQILSTKGLIDISWKSPVYFSESQSTALLGQKGFFEHVDVNLSWRKREIEVLV